ncbi:hypothetical protein RFI_36536, partial [Reticulomyxa filosa]
MTESKEEKDKIEQLCLLLKNEVDIDDGQASKIVFLYQTLGLKKREDMAFIEPEDWKSIFEQVTLTPIQKRRLLKIVNTIRKEEGEELLDKNFGIKVDPVPRSKVAPTFFTTMHTFLFTRICTKFVVRNRLCIDHTFFFFFFNQKNRVRGDTNKTALYWIKCMKYIENSVIVPQPPVKQEPQEDHDTEKDELKPGEGFSHLEEQKTASNDVIWIISQDYSQQAKRLRIYLCCPKPEHGRVRTVFFLNIPEADQRYPLKLVNKDTPWLYWRDFYVASNSDLSFNIFDQVKQTTNATVPASSQAIIVEEQSVQLESNEKSARILKHLACGIEDEPSFCFALTVFNNLKTQLRLSKSQDIENVLNDNTPNLDQSNASSKQVYQILFVRNIWSEWDIKQCLSSKQLFIIVRTLAKDKSADQFPSPFIQSIRSDLDSVVSNSARYEVSSTLIDRLRLIPCVNYLALSNWQQLIISFNKFFQRFDFQSSKVQSINENELIEVLTFDLTLRKNRTFHPIVWIEDYLIKLLSPHNQLMQLTLQLLLDYNNYDKTADSNPWKKLWKSKKCWPLFQSFFKVQFEEWDTFIAKLQQCVVNFVEIANKLLQGFQSTEFQPLYIFFFLFWEEKKKQIGDLVVINRWKDRNSITKTIDPFYDKIEGEGLAVMVKLIWADTSANVSNESVSLTARILEQLFKNETNRKYLIELLANPDINPVNPVLQILQSSFKDWLNVREEEYLDDKQPFHSKVIELLCSSTFQKAKLYHSNFMEILDDRYHELRMDNDKWTDDQIKMIQDCADKKSELFEKVICTMEKDFPKVEKLNEENVEPESEKLCLNLDYCFKCRLWFKQDNPMQKSLFTFFNKLLTNLTNENLLPIHVYKYLATHLNKIKELSYLTKSTELIKKLEEMVNKYQQFSKLIGTFKQVYNDFLIEDDLSLRLKELKKESNNWKMQKFVETKNRYAQELQILEEQEKCMEIVLAQRDSSIFRKIWERKKTEQSVTNQQSFFIFNRMFQDSNKKWEDFKQDLQNGTIKYKDLEWMSIARSNETDHIMECLENEMKYLFPRLSDEERQSIVND